MSAMKTLVRLEYSRYNLSRLGKHYRLLTALILVIGTVLIGIYLPGSRSSERIPFIYAALLVWSAVTVLSAVSMVSFMNAGSRDWMLSFPHSRLKLLYAKMISLLGHSLQLTLAVLLAAVMLYLYSVRSGWYPPLSMPGLLYLVAAYTLFMLIFLPLAVVFGLAISLFLQPGRLARLLFIPYTALWMSPFIVDGIYGTGYSGAQAAAPGSPGFMLYASLAAAAAGWPLSHLLMLLVAARGLEAEGQEVRSSSPTGASRRFRSGTLRITRNTGLQKDTSTFMMLYRLYAGRTRRTEKHPAVLSLKLAVPPMVAAVFYFGITSNVESVVLSLMRSLFGLVITFSSVWVLLRSSSERKQLPWLLSFPQSRLALLLSGIAVVWTTAMRIMVILLLSAAAGSVTALIAGNTGLQDWSQTLIWLLYFFLFYVLVLTVMLCLLQLEYYTMKAPVLGILMFPVSLLGLMGGVFLNKIIFLPAELHTGILPDWSLLGWIALIGLPAAFCCIPAGARYYHLSLSRPAGKKQA